MSRYAEAIAASRPRCLAEQVGIWFYDDLDADYERTVSEILRFLECLPLAGRGPGCPRVNISGTPRSRCRARRASAGPPGNERIRTVVKAQHVVPVAGAGPAGSAQDATPSARARAELTPRFADDLAQLAALVDGPVPALAGRATGR